MLTELMLRALLTLLLAVFVFAAWILVHILLKQRKSPLWVIPGPPSANAFFGNLKDLNDSPNDAILDEWAEKYGSVVRINGFLKTPLLLLTDTRALTHILAHTDEYQLPEFIRRDLSKIVCEGVLVAAGYKHKQQRKVMNPAFGPSQIREATGIFLEKAIELRNLWNAEVLDDAKGTRVDVLHGLNMASLDAIGLAGFNYNFGALDSHKKPNEVVATLEQVFSMQNQKPLLVLLKNLAPILNHITDPNMVLVDRAVALMKGIGSQVIENKKAQLVREVHEGKKGTQERDLLTLLVKANLFPEDGLPLSDEDVLNQVPTYLIAGHQTTSDATTWCLNPLSCNQRVQNKLRAEVVKVPTDSPSMDELAALPYLDMVVRETLRLHPPIISTVRTAIKDDNIPLEKPFKGTDGKLHHSVNAPEGTLFLISVVALHRSKALWGDNAAEFRPERWESPPEATSSIPGVWGHLLTFGGGPRACIGYRFAVAEIKALVFTLLRAFEFAPAVEPAELGTMPGVVLRPYLRDAPEAGSQLPLLLKRCEHV